jgi:hypothetical protein
MYGGREGGESAGGWGRNARAPAIALAALQQANGHVSALRHLRRTLGINRAGGCAGGGVHSILPGLLQARYVLPGRPNQREQAQSVVRDGLLVRLRDEYTLVVHGHALLSGPAPLTSLMWISSPS